MKLTDLFEAKKSTRPVVLFFQIREGNVIRCIKDIPNSVTLPQLLQLLNVSGFENCTITNRINSGVQRPCISVPVDDVNMYIFKIDMEPDEFDSFFSRDEDSQVEAILTWRQMLQLLKDLNGYDDFRDNT